MPMKPVMSLSKTWKPRQYSSGSPGSRKPPGRLRTRWKVSKSTIVLKKTKRISHIVMLIEVYCYGLMYVVATVSLCVGMRVCVRVGLVGMGCSAIGCQNKHGFRDHSQSLPMLFSKSRISFMVGFWPHARSRSPRLSRVTRPLPRLSKSEKASL